MVDRKINRDANLPRLCFAFLKKRFRLFALTTAHVLPHRRNTCWRIALL